MKLNHNAIKWSIQKVTETPQLLADSRETSTRRLKEILVRLVIPKYKPIGLYLEIISDAEMTFTDQERKIHTEH